MTKGEKKQCETIIRYLKDGFSDLDCGKIAAGKSSVEKWLTLLDVLLSLSTRKESK
ncbi:hypothetical protein Q2V87_002205 [Salmonella enterica]|nr:hypothetical protein [Salmonella enterica]